MNEALVLLIEDNERNSKLTIDLLRHRGLDTVLAADGASGLALAASARPDVILLDIQLPDLDGREVLGRLRADPATATVPVLAVTAYAMEGDREAFLAAGFDDYITKPIDVVEFVDQVRAHLPAARR
jgi:two-component system cell cycle response regulator DivK